MRATPTAPVARTDVDLRDELARVHPQAFAWAVRCCRDDRANAEDVLHDAYMKALDGRARFEGRSSFRTWLFGVIRRTAHEHNRRGWLRLTRLQRWWREQRESPDASVESSVDDRVGAIRGAMSSLSKRQQEILHLVFYQGLTAS